MPTSKMTWNIREQTSKSSSGNITIGSGCTPRWAIDPRKVEAGVLLLTFFVVIPSIAAAIGYAAWKGKPKNFNREMYWTSFAAATVASLLLMVFAQRMHADVRTWLYLVRVACFALGALLFGVAGGCTVGIFTYRRGVGIQDPPR
jgi:undecaprenyl pyrophosphate phosphatase UppP